MECRIYITMLSDYYNIATILRLILNNAFNIDTMWTEKDRLVVVACKYFTLIIDAEEAKDVDHIINDFGVDVDGRIYVQFIVSQSEEGLSLFFGLVEEFIKQYNTDIVVIGDTGEDWLLRIGDKIIVYEPDIDEYGIELPFHKLGLPFIYGGSSHG